MSRVPPDRSSEAVFDLDVDLGGPVRNGLFRAARPVIERATGLRRVRRIYEVLPEGLDAVGVFDWLLDRVGVTLRVDDRDLARVPERGPALLVCNHPYGPLDGVALAVALARRRPDARFLANFLLSRIPEIESAFIPVDPFGRSGSVAANLRGMRRALGWLRSGGLLATFPAGEVASLDLRRRRVSDPPWNPMIARLARQADCPIVPAHVVGRNGAAFQIAGLVHPLLRTALLPRQMLNKRGATLEIRIGSPIPPAQLRSFDDDRERIAYVRDRTEILAAREMPAVGPVPVQPRQTPDEAAPVVDPVPPETLEAEIDALPADALVAEGEGLHVYLAGADRIPGVLREIGRLRETTFRLVGEGTGREIDLDRFDPYYMHLFVWNRARREVVGAYRLGRTDELIARFGIDGLYTSSLFDFRSKLFEQMGPALEMGRSFIRQEYQRSYTGLLLLWKGIGTFLARNPRYATLFGPVSISAVYRSESQRLMVAFLSQNRYIHEWSRWVRPRTPFQPNRTGGSDVGPNRLRTLEDVSTFIREVESDQRGVPILLKQYLKLGGRLLGFNVDPDFANVLDVLLLVDARRTESKILARYMGRDQAERFLSFHASEGAGTLAG